jgi:hypothetical protein
VSQGRSVGAHWKGKAKPNSRSTHVGRRREKFAPNRGDAGAAVGEIHTPASGDFMKPKTKHNFRLVVNFSDKAVFRVRFSERDRNGNYVPIERPWGGKELNGLKLAAKAVILPSRGVADLQEVCRTVTAPRRRKVGKKRLAEDRALQTSRAGRRHNGPDRNVAHSA